MWTTLAGILVPAIFKSLLGLFMSGLSYIIGRFHQQQIMKKAATADVLAPALAAANTRMAIDQQVEATPAPSTPDTKGPTNDDQQIGSSSTTTNIAPTESAPMDTARTNVDGSDSLRDTWERDSATPAAPSRQ